MKKMAAILAGIGLLMAATSALALPSYPNIGQLQTVLNNIASPYPGTSSVNVATDMISDGNDAYWHITATGGSVATMIVELGSFAPGNKLFVYDSANKDNKVVLFEGNAAEGSQALLSIHADGKVFVNFSEKGVFKSTNFGYGLDSATYPNGGVFYSDTKFNELTNGQLTDHMLAYQGKGTDLVKIDPYDAGIWTKNEYILAFEDLYGPGSDFNFTDMVVMVESVNPVPEPGTILLIGGGLLGLAFYGRRRMRS